MRQVLAVVGMVMLSGCWETVRPPDAPTVVCEGDVPITTSQELAAFAARGCTILTGTLSISGAELTEVHLDALTDVGALEVVGGSLLRDVSLGSLRRATGGGQQCRRSGYRSTCSVGSHLWDNPVLARISLPGLVSSPGLDVQGNASLNQVVLTSLAEVTHGLVFSGNDGLTTLELPALTSVGGIVNCWGISMESMTCVPGLEISANPSLVDLQVPRLASAGSISIGSDAALSSFLAPKLETAAALSIVDNTSLVSVDLPALRAMDSTWECCGGDVCGYTCSSYLQVSSNGSLELLSAPSLRSIRDLLGITDNAVLPQCAAEALLAQLSTPPARNFFSGNDTTATCTP